MKPQKHAELIKAWADGAEIQKRGLIGSPTYTPDWEDEENPRWLNDYWEYRIKPEPKPDVVYYYHKHFVDTELKPYGRNVKALADNDALKLTFDGETGELKSAEVLR